MLSYSRGIFNLIPASPGNTFSRIINHWSDTVCRGKIIHRQQTGRQLPTSLVSMWSQKQAFLTTRGTMSLILNEIFSIVFEKQNSIQPRKKSQKPNKKNIKIHTENATSWFFSYSLLLPTSSKSTTHLMYTYKWASMADVLKTPM